MDAQLIGRTDPGEQQHADVVEWERRDQHQIRGPGPALRRIQGLQGRRFDQRVRQASNEEHRSLLLIVALSLLAVVVGVFITVAAFALAADTAT